MCDSTFNPSHIPPLITTKDAPALTKEGIPAIQVDYTDKDSLVEHLRGVNAVLSFITAQTDPDNIAQKTLINASIEAGVKRFAPNEWSTYVLMRLLGEKWQPINGDKAGVTVDSNGMQGRMRSMSISNRSTRTKRSVYYYEFVPQTTNITRFWNTPCSSQVYS